VELSFVLDREMQDGALRVGDSIVPLSNEGSVYTASLLMTNDSQYQLVDRMLDREVPAPEVRIVSPGRDVSASPIEELQVNIEAKDDFAIESVELLFSVNAGPWQSVNLPPTELNSHTFYLESMGTLPLDAAASGESGKTDMLLVDVRPFERRFSEGESGAGGGGGGAANEGSEISRRQKEILLATWNLQRTTEAADGDTSGLEDKQNRRLPWLIVLKPVILSNKAKRFANLSITCGKPLKR